MRPLDILLRHSGWFGEEGRGCIFIGSHLKRSHPDAAVQSCSEYPMTSRSYPIALGINSTAEFELHLGNAVRIPCM